MTRARKALILILVLGFAVPALAQGPSATQGGPHGSAPGPIAPQLQAAQQSLLNADQQLSQSRTGGQRPNYEQALAAVLGAEDTLAEMRSATGGRDNPLIGTAERELAETRRLLEVASPNLTQVGPQLRLAVSALTAIGSATGATTGGTPAPGQPALGGGNR